MSTTPQANIAAKQGAEDAGKYFRYMAEFVGFKPEDADVIRRTKPIIEQHLPDIVGKFYSHLLRYPPTRQWFLKPDNTLDQAYLELRMRHLTNFWVRTAEGNFDDEYARYVDYVGRAHTSHGADRSAPYARDNISSSTIIKLSQASSARKARSGSVGCRSRIITLLMACDIKPTCPMT